MSCRSSKCRVIGWTLCIALHSGKRKSTFEYQHICPQDLQNIPAGCTPIRFENEFDAIDAFDVREHIGDDELVLSQMYPVVRKGAGILLTVRRHSLLCTELDKYSRHVRRYCVTEKFADCLLRLPFYIGMTQSEQV
jgi:hypothetical protein